MRLSKAQTKLATRTLSHAIKYLTYHRRQEEVHGDTTRLLFTLEQDVAKEALAAGYYKRYLGAFHHCGRAQCWKGGAR